MSSYTKLPKWLKVEHLTVGAIPLYLWPIIHQLLQEFITKCPQVATGIKEIRFSIFTAPNLCTQEPPIIVAFKHGKEFFIHVQDWAWDL